MRLGTWLEEAATWLSHDAAVPIVTDPRDVRVPGGIVYPETITANRLDASTYDVTFRVILVAAGATKQALDALGRLASTLDTVTGGLPWESTTIADPNLSGSGDPLPALSAPITLECED